MKKKQNKAPLFTKSKIKWIKTRYQGVYYRLSQGAKVNENGKPDRCFFLRYKKEGRRIMEKVGWGSDGYSAETAKGIRAERIRAIWHGEELPREKTKVPHFEEAAKLFLGWAENNKTDRNDQSRYENHLREAFKKKRLNEISPFDLEMIKSKFSRKISPPLPFATFFSL